MGAPITNTPAFSVLLDDLPPRLRTCRWARLYPAQEAVVTKRLFVLTLLSLAAFIATAPSIPTGSGSDPAAEPTFEVAQRYCPRGRC
jgi:hypothetical protein